MWLLGRKRIKERSETNSAHQTTDRRSGQTGYHRWKHPTPALLAPHPPILYFSSSDRQHNDLKQLPRMERHCVASSEARKKKLSKRNSSVAGRDWLEFIRHKMY